MRDLSRRYRGLLAGLAIFGVIAWTSQSFTMPPASGSTNSHVTVPAASSMQQAATGFIEVAKSVTPAIVNITRAAEKRTGDGQELQQPFRNRGEWPEWMEKFFDSPRGPAVPRGPEGPLDPRGPRENGMGSGVIVSPDGYILTNNHVVEGATEVTVTLPDKQEFTGKVVGLDPKTDLAVVKIDAKHLPYVRWGDSSKLQVGEPVLAIGNPFGLTSTVTQGIVSALGRGRMGITQYEDFIQTDAAINPGNSGGALVNTKGELVGINTAIMSRTGGYQGIGFAVPVSMAKPVYQSLVKTGRVVRGYLGIGIQDVTNDLAESFELQEAKGALVGDVKEGSPADRAGLNQGDVIITYQGSPVEDPAALQRMVTRTRVGTKAALTVIRDGKETNLTVTVGEQADPTKVARGEEERAQHAMIGLAVEDLDSRTARALGLQENTRGVVVAAVQPGSAADRAGLARGDVIREINRRPIASVREFEEVASAMKEDQRVLLLINRRGASLFVSVKV